MVRDAPVEPHDEVDPVALDGGLGWGSGRAGLREPPGPEACDNGGRHRGRPTHYPAEMTSHERKSQTMLRAVARERTVPTTARAGGGFRLSTAVDLGTMPSAHRRPAP